jgi:hypothetical protein
MNIKQQVFLFIRLILFLINFYQLFFKYYIISHEKRTIIPFITSNSNQKVFFHLFRKNCCHKSPNMV